MNWTDDSLDKLEKIFEIKYEDFENEADDAFLDFCDKYEIVLIEKEEQRWWLNFNIDHVIVQNPESKVHENIQFNFVGFEFMAIPKQFAEKCLILGHIPD